MFSLHEIISHSLDQFLVVFLGKYVDQAFKMNLITCFVGSSYANVCVRYIIIAKITYKRYIIIAINMLLYLDFLVYMYILHFKCYIFL